MGCKHAKHQDMSQLPSFAGNIQHGMLAGDAHELFAVHDEHVGSVQVSSTV